MTHIFDAKKTREYFNGLESDISFVSKSDLPRKDIFFELILPLCLKKKSGDFRIVDFGCGGGRLLKGLLDRKLDAVGIDKHEELCRSTRALIGRSGYPAKRVLKGGVEALRSFSKESVDLVLVMGVMQYLSKEDYEHIYENLKYILKPGGHMVCSFQNAFFDLFTFNKYTLDFYREKLILPLGLDKMLGEEIYGHLRKMITFPDKPAYLHTRARDNIFVRTTNPITIAEELKQRGFTLLNRYFYDFHFLPPFIEPEYKERLRDFTKDFQTKHSTEWYGYFMADAFLVDSVKKAE